MRRLLIGLLWIAAVASVVVAVGMRVRSSRLMDARQTLRGWLRDVPPEVSGFGRIVLRDGSNIQVELRADPRWIRIFAQRNGFIASDSVLSGFTAERWVLTETKRAGYIAHILLPDQGPALVTISGAPASSLP
jgi:hypothetical protein